MSDQQKVQIPTASLADPKEGFSRDFDRAWSETGFVSITGYNDVLPDASIDTEKARLYHALEEFMRLPQQVKMRYYIDIGGQRGYTPNGIEQSGGKAFTEWREHVMVGPRIPLDHPLRDYQPYRLYLENPEISEVPQLIPIAENLLESLEQLDFIMYERLAEHLGLHPGYFSARLAWGDSSLRLHHYQKLEDDVEIIRAKQVDGVTVLMVRFPDGSTIPNLVRAGKHTDVDFSASLLGAEAPGLYIQARDGTAVAYTASPNSIVVNTGDYAQRETAGKYPSSAHWVEMTEQTARKDRFSVVRFTHQRPRVLVRTMPTLRTPEAVYPDEFEGVLLLQRLWEIGYLKPEERDERIEIVRTKLMPDDDLVAKIMKWEQENGVRKITRYFDDIREYKHVMSAGIGSAR